MHKRGRPKGSEKIVIRLSWKRLKGKCATIPFMKKHPSEKERGNLMHCYITLDVATNRIWI